VAEVGGGISEDRALQLFTSALNSAGLGDVNTWTLAQLATQNPTAYAKRTAWVSDLYDVGGRVVSEGGAWKPIRPLVTGLVTSSTMSTTPLLTPTTLVLTGTIAVGVTHNITLGAGTGFAIPYPGYRQRVVKPSGVLGTLNVIGVVTKALTGWADFEWDGTAWYQTASGGLL